MVKSKLLHCIIYSNAQLETQLACLLIHTFEQFDGYREADGLPHFGGEFGVPEGPTDHSLEDEAKRPLTQVVLHNHISSGDLGGGGAQRLECGHHDQNCTYTSILRTLFMSQCSTVEPLNVDILKFKHFYIKDTFLSNLYMNILILSCIQ